MEAASSSIFSSPTNSYCTNNQNSRKLEENFYCSNVKNQQYQMRGLNNNKASPDSGWTFPAGMINQQQIIPGVSPQQAANFMLTGNNSNKMYQQQTNSENRNANNLIRDNMYRGGVVQNTFQTKVVTPYGEMSWRQQQQLFENANFNQNNCGGLNMFPIKSFDQNYSSNINNHQNPNPSDLFISQINRALPTPLVTPTEAMQNINLSNNKFSKDFQNDIPTNKITTMESNGHTFKNTPVGTPSNEMKTLNDTLMQPFLNLKPTLNFPDIRYMSTQIQNGSIYNYFPAIVNNTTLKTPTEERYNKENSFERRRRDSCSTTTSNSNELIEEPKNILPQKVFDNTSDATFSHLRPAFSEALNYYSQNLNLISPSLHSRSNNIGNLKSNEETRQTNLHPYSFDPRAYQAVSTSTAGVANSYAVYSSTDMRQNNRSSPSQPQRPNHLGNFIPSSHFLSVNVNHGATPSSDKESLLSSSSPGRHSPYSNSSRHSRTPSPHSVNNDKKERPENTCSQCGKHFSSSSALAKHKLIHSDERKYICHICTRGFKRQDHLNGHMITHQDKKPYECDIPNCGKSYCDSRSLRRHMENHHHSSPLGGATPGSYMPTLYPEYSEEMMKIQHKQNANRLLIPSEPPRPSSAPLVPPDAKRITRNRRSSSGEETGLQLDPMMIRELESRKTKTHGRNEGNTVTSVIDSSHSLQSHYSPHSIGLLAKSAASMPTASQYNPAKTDYEQHSSAAGFDRKQYEQYRTEYSNFYAEKHREHLLKEASQANLKNHHPKVDVKHSDILHKESEASKRKMEFPPAGYPPNYPPGIGPPMISPRYLWNQISSNQNTQSTSANMPYLLNIRNPFGFPGGHSPYPPQLPPAAAESNAKEHAKGEHIRQQAMNTYLQMWANGQRGNLTPEQLSMYQNQMMRSQNLPTPTDATAIAVAAAKDQSERPYSMYRDGFHGIHPAIAQWQSTVLHDENSRKNEKETKPYFPHPSSQHSNNNNNNEINFMKPPSSHEATPRYSSHERNIIDEPFKPSETNQKSDHYRYNVSPHRAFYERSSRPPNLPSSHLHDHQHAFEDHHTRMDRPRSLDPSRIMEGAHHRYGDSIRTHESSIAEQRNMEPPKSLDIKKSPISPNRFDGVMSTPKLEIPRVHIDTHLVSTSSLSPGKKRPRPGPIIIPSFVNNRTQPGLISPKNFQALAKAIYTPPAMLSPKSVFFNPPAPTPRAAIPPGTPARFLLSIRRSTSVDQREASVSTSVSSEDQLQISTEVPEPKINVGLQFQAVLPNKVDRSEAQKDIHRASLMWAPIKEDEVKKDEINAYLDMACSLALYGGSNNKEYALHILQRTRGNVKEAVRLLLSRRHILRADDPNADYHYSGSVRWTAKERLSFRQAYRTKGKVFVAIQKEVITKSVQLCVEFYYLWKAMHPESFRARTRIVEVESDCQDDEEVPPTPTAPVAPLSTLREPVFECDYPECRARFVSRQALNGHIRVHGGSLTKPSDSRRPKQKAGQAHTPGVEGMPAIPSPPKKKKPSTAASVIVTNTSEGPQLQFQCKVCGRVFGKVKSRSAHMKTHVKRDENNKPIKTPKAQKQSQKQLQQKQLQQQQQMPPVFPAHLPPPLPPHHNLHESPLPPHHSNSHEPPHPSSMKPMINPLYA